MTTLFFTFANKGSERLSCLAKVTQLCKQQDWNANPELLLLYKGSSPCSAALSQKRARHEQDVGDQALTISDFNTFVFNTSFPQTWNASPDKVFN